MPYAGETALLSDAAFVLKPNVDLFGLNMFGQYGFYFVNKVFLKASCASGSACGWRLRAVIQLMPIRCNKGYRLLLCL